MVLCDRELEVALQYGHLKITPQPPGSRIKTSAIDLTLGKEFKRWKPLKGGMGPIDPGDPDFDFEQLAADLTEVVPLEADGSCVLKPKDFLLGITEEKVELPEQSKLAARVEGRSQLARLGLAVHLTAPTIHSGFRGKITLEITNHGVYQLKLRPGLRVCQLIVECLHGTPAKAMTSIFQDQQSVLGK